MAWGLDILGPFPTTTGGLKFLFVAIDTFTKWIEAELVTKITSEAAIRFILKNVITRFSVPSRIITDNGTQFASAAFTEYCEELGTKICFASVAHPQSNGQVERANSLVLQGIKKRVYDRLMAHRKAWVIELPTVLWAIRTTAS